MLNISVPVIKAPPKTTGSKIAKVRDWIANADLGGLLGVPNKKKRKFKWRKS
jgi:hypothetical protein